MMKMNLKTLPTLFGGLATAALLCAGCMTSNPDRLHKKVIAWVPVGTSAEEAKRMMERHGFRCVLGVMESGTPSGPMLECRRENRLLNQTWIVRLFLQDNRVVQSEEG